MTTKVLSPAGLILVIMAQLLCTTVLWHAALGQEKGGGGSSAPGSGQPRTEAAPSEPSRMGNAEAAPQISIAAPSGNPSQANAPRESQAEQQKSPDQQSAPEQKPSPVGTAAAETPNTGGVAASQPAGTAIAPVKQRRTRALFIKVGAVLGTGVAVGTVWALSHSSPSRPPGSH